MKSAEMSLIDISFVYIALIKFNRKKGVEIFKKMQELGFFIL